MQNPIIVALDLPGADTALRLAAELAPAVGAFKIGFELFTQAGPDVVRRVRELGAPVFLDLKFHDIPNTVAKGRLGGHGNGRLNAHPPHQRRPGHDARGRPSRPRFRRPRGNPRPLVLGVTVLTSMDDAELAAWASAKAPPRRSNASRDWPPSRGIGGLVCSPLEVALLRRVLPPQIQLVTPGIRAGRRRRGRPETHLERRRSHRRGRHLAGDRPAHLRRSQSPAPPPSASWPRCPDARPRPPDLTPAGPGSPPRKAPRPGRRRRRGWLG